MQALTLWDIGLRKWDEKRGGKEIPKKRSGVPINRRDLSALPVPSALLLWRDLHVRNVERPLIDGKRSTKTQYIRIEITVEGVSNGVPWSQGLEFDYANDESIYCRPLGMTDSDNGQLSPLAVEALKMRVVFLPPMSGLSDREFVKEPGEIGVLIGQGQTAQVLRNLCYQLKKRDDQSEWQALTRQVERLFGVKLLDPEYIVDRSEIVMQYEERGTRLDLSCAGPKRWKRDWRALRAACCHTDAVA